MDLGLKDKVAVVFAASKGLGKATALALANEGCRVAICSRNEENITKTTSEEEKEVNETEINITEENITEIISEDEKEINETEKNTTEENITKITPEEGNRSTILNITEQINDTEKNNSITSNESI